MIEPPEYIIMEVNHSKGDQKWKTIVPCERQQGTLEYKKTDVTRNSHVFPTK